jgi:hypothetical protein
MSTVMPSRMVSSWYSEDSVTGCGGGSSPRFVGWHQRFIHEAGPKWKCRREFPRRHNLEVEMPEAHLALVLKILAILELIIKALVIVLTQ